MLTKMVTCMTIETASLVFASLILLITSLGSLLCITSTVYVYILLVNLLRDSDMKTSINFEAQFFLYYNIGFAVILSFMVVALVFSIILIKGLISKKAHLVKAYYVYGVTTNTLGALILLSIYISPALHDFGVVIFLGCFVHAIILNIIRKTYLKLDSPDFDQFLAKKLEAEK